MKQEILCKLILLAGICSSAHIREEHYNITTVRSDYEGGCRVENATYANGEKVPSLGPCEECYCRSSDVICSMIKCKPNNSGCKVLQQANHCCPQYKCECEFNGRIYNNGERLERPDDPCWVCYCKGGEVMCTSITCYERNDCNPHYVPGQCCPKYDHCPIENQHSSGNNEASGNSTNFSGKREMQPWLLTVAVNNHTSPVAANVENTSPNSYPQTIKIIEILPTQIPQIQKSTKLTIFPENIYGNDQAEQDAVVDPSSDSKQQIVSTIQVTSAYNENHFTATSEGNNESDEKTESALNTNFPQGEYDLNKSDIMINDEQLTANITDVINLNLFESSTMINNIDTESITLIKNDNEFNSDQGHFITNSENVSKKEQKLTESDVLAVLGKLDTLNLHSENKEFTNTKELEEENTSVENHWQTTYPSSLEPQKTDRREQLSIEISTEGSLEEHSTDGYKQQLVNEEKVLTTEEDHEYKVTEEERVMDTSGNSVYEEVLPTENIEVPQYLLSGQFREQVKKSVQPIDYVTASGGDSSTINEAQLGNNFSPDSESYTTILPEKFNSNLIELITEESNSFDGTEGSGFELINGWTYSDPTSEVYPEHSSKMVEVVNSERSSLKEILSTVSVEDVQVERLNSSEYRPTLLPNELESTKTMNKQEEFQLGVKSNFVSLPQRNSSSVSAEYITDVNDHIQDPPMFASILKLNNQIQFLKIEDQHSTSDGKKSAPIARIGIYNPNKPNEVANLVTVVRDNSDNYQHMMNHKSLNTGEDYTPHILLTPNDLKTLAEILIHEKIMPPFNQNYERATNTLEQRSFNGGGSKEVKGRSGKDKEYVENSTESVETTSEEDHSALVEIVDLASNTSKKYEDMVVHVTNPPPIPVNLTDKEKWAQSVIDKVVSNILIPLTDVEIVDLNVTSSENSTLSEVENTTAVNDFSEESITLSELITEEDLVENITEANSVEESTVINSEYSTEGIMVSDTSIENVTDSEVSKTTQKSQPFEEDSSKSIQGVNTRQSRDPSSSFVSPLLATSMLDDKDLMLLHNFFKKNLNTK